MDDHASQPAIETLAVFVPSICSEARLEGLPHDGPAGRVLEAMGRSPMRPAHVHFWIKAAGYRDLITHVFDVESDFLDGDAVFGVQRSLIREFKPDDTGELATNFDIVLDRV